MDSGIARDILRRVRRLQHLSQAELARRAGVSRTVVARYESGRQQPTLRALDHLVWAAGYELQWSVRHLAGPDETSATPTSGRRIAEGTVTGTGVEEGGSSATHPRFPGPIGRRLTSALDEVLDQLAIDGLTDPRLYGGVADGSEGVNCSVFIGVTVPPDAEPLALLRAGTFIGFTLHAQVIVVSYERLPDYGFDVDEGVPLTPAKW